MKADTRVNGPWSDNKIYQGKDLPTTLYTWQEQVKHFCTSPPDDRSINYIYDPIGNTGKSKFCKYMCYHHGALMLPWGKTGDLLNLVVKKGAKDIYLFDLSRSKPQDWARDDIASAMEQIKNGHIVNLKYETNDFMMEPPHVWCFSNQLPNLESMSRDRWQLWEIDNVRRLVRITTRRLCEIRASLKPNRSRSPSPRRSDSQQDIIDLSQDLTF
jgi:hypothetical protein